MNKYIHLCIRSPAGCVGTCVIHFSILIGRYVFVFFKGPDKIAALIKTTFKADGCYGQIGVSQQIRRMVNTVHGDVIHGCLMCDFFKDPAEVPWIHACHRGKLLQCDGRAIVLLHIFQNGLDLTDPVSLSYRLGRILGVELVLQNQRKEAADAGYGDKLVKRFLV